MRCSGRWAKEISGRHYPSSDQRFKNISSLKLLEDVVGKLRAKGYRLANVDSTIIAQAPRLSPHLAAMQKHIAGVLQVDPELGERESEKRRRTGCGGTRGSGRRSGRLFD